MGLENVKLNLKGSKIQYQGKILYVVEEIEYKNEKYLYTINTEKVPKVEINFLKKETDKVYVIVKDEKLFDVLLANVGLKVLEEKTKQINKAQKTNLHKS